jgi:hypothetical protein
MRFVYMENVTVDSESFFQTKKMLMKLTYSVKDSF